jgi:hypothetical protein
VTKFTGSQIHDAINAWAETQVDAEITESIERNKAYIEKYGESPSRYARRVQLEVEDFDREEVRDQIAESFYEHFDSSKSDPVELPGLGTVEFVENFGGEGMGDSQWLVFKIGDQHYQADHYYSSYDGGEPWHGNCTIFAVEGKPVTKIEWVAL